MSHSFKEYVKIVKILMENFHIIIFNSLKIRVFINKYDKYI